jgi:hypothetical protein
MASEPPKDEPTAEVTTAAAVTSEAGEDAAPSAPNEVLDALVARDAALAAEMAPRPASAPSKPSTPAQEWGVAIVLMIVFGFICVAFMSFFRG